MKTVTLPSGEVVPALGLGTWRLAEHMAAAAEEIAALQHGIDRGATLVDTAEMYADGAAERLVGQAVEGRRDRVFLVSKVYPHNAGRHSTAAACDRSLRRLRTDRIDLYLLHWRGDEPLAETVEAFERLRAVGKIRHWGVSNLDVGDMTELLALEAGPACATNQVLYNLATRGIEWDLEPLCRERGIPIMAYSPLDQARLLEHPGLRTVAAANGLTCAQVAIAWTLRSGRVISIPKAGTREHVDETLAAADVHLEPDVFDAIDRLFRPPTRPEPLAML
jgi:diketogulonate reductase-like aldo/keto reductase